MQLEMTWPQKKQKVAQTLAEYQEEQIARIRYILKEVEDNYMYRRRN